MKTRLGHGATQSRRRIPELMLFSLALCSLIYAVVTAPGRGIDVRAFQDGAREWMTGVFQIGAGPIGEYPPFALPLFSPLASMSSESLIKLWIALNLAAAVLILYLSIELWGKQWTVKARLCLFAGLVASAPFRVTVRNGQISLMIYGDPDVRASGKKPEDECSGGRASWNLVVQVLDDVSIPALFCMEARMEDCPDGSADSRRADSGIRVAAGTVVDGACRPVR